MSGHGGIVSRYCHLLNREAEIAIPLDATFEENVNLLGVESVKCLDAQAMCIGLRCVLAAGNINPFEPSV